ncbi:nicotinate-nucleotide pyrophosphorylase [carboxylating] [Solea senegalensis]|uniref:Nicotinate-nucleotide pyrophosphorylase [carboxylating] n=1 Tax=Solea senegalensis TaxID=28829 RepID=A0AAV6Q6T5_SOLSE|nr:nicotinate-nucleotide pyrophosphorylase [carboxylating]-like isoform X1 [Solea senegalensis]KAG7485293.1 nicotinate-nucleotide pyrophosphorylase [carboxylating] [Solea senegalensis]
MCVLSLPGSLLWMWRRRRKKKPQSGSAQSRLNSSCVTSAPLFCSRPLTGSTEIASHSTSCLCASLRLHSANAIPPHTLTQLARRWLAEDTPNFDPAGVCVGSREVEARLLCKTPNSILAGRPFFTAVFTEVGCTVDWTYQEGADIGPDAVTVTAVVRGPARCLLLGERPALNCLARASGIATRCSQLQAAAAAGGWHGEVAGTRKTTPGFRLVEKYAMLVGGVAMHRQDLSGMVMLKDNHVWASGSISEAVKAARSVCGFSSKIEVECCSAEQGREAAAAGADIVMLDNFKPQVKEASTSCLIFTAYVPHKHTPLSPLQELHAAARSLKTEFPTVLIESSGGIDPENLSLYLSPHVDIISLGCVTQGCPVVDFSLKVQKPE